MSIESTSINISSSAVKRIQGLLPDQKSNYFRVYVTGGGCSGFQYGFKFDDSPAGDDDVLDCGGFNILLDSLSYPYLYGSTLDYVEDLSGSRFLINNPNAKTTCGCGESFTI
jgi:iron-sulfur cluster insertion protein|tara:strand:- start:107 stop:442 length:336 start_codon:yes stop_codon:yes gene_type:complete